MKPYYDCEVCKARSEGMRCLNVDCTAYMCRREPILVEREKQHGDFARTALISQQLKSYTRSCNQLGNKRQQEALDMICMKIARILAGDPMVKDHWDDVAGYAKLGAEACE